MPQPCPPYLQKTVTRHGRIALESEGPESSPSERALIEAILDQLRDSPEDAPALLRALLRKAISRPIGGNNDHYS